MALAAEIRIDKRQIVKIHTLKGALKMSDDSYRLTLQSINAMSHSSKDLSYGEAEQLIAHLEGLATDAGAWETRGSRKTRYEHLADRPDMATPKQLRKIEALWADVSYHHRTDEQQRALRAFLFNKFKISDISFVRRSLASKVIKALESMQPAIRKGEAF